MTARKQRLTVTVDPELIEAGNHAVASGTADSLSGWVGIALTEMVQKGSKNWRTCKLAIAGEDRVR